MGQVLSKLGVNEVRTLSTIRGEARLRVQVSTDGHLGIRSAAAHGERGELVALSVLEDIRRKAIVLGVGFRALTSRRGGVNVMDALDFSDGAKARELKLVSMLFSRGN